MTWVLAMAIFGSMVISAVNGITAVRRGRWRSAARWDALAAALLTVMSLMSGYAHDVGLFVDATGYGIAAGVFGTLARTNWERRDW